jgi:bifunctional UDP-N-acetylglucosamine pyrophosphorylase/glucosamine-1-phosphate N-acetyltransferase
LQQSVNTETRESESIQDIRMFLENLSSPLNRSSNEVSVILAAGHGKRIKSEKSKMLHEIWGKSSVWRVSEAAQKGLSTSNQIIVVGKKAVEVARALGKKENRVFVLQAEQRGTGDAVRTALSFKGLKNFTGVVYVFPGDMGLLSRSTVEDFKKDFTSSGCDMIVMTGFFKGDISENYYGRIVKSRLNDDQIIEIKEHRDILAMEAGSTYRVNFHGNTETFTREELLSIREFNVGVYAFSIDKLRRFIETIQSDNVQSEIYITDLIKIYNNNGLTVSSSKVGNSDLVVSFNVKSVLKKMDATFRDMVYEKLKDIITIDDPEDFFIAEPVVDRILRMDKKHPILGIHIGKGAYIDEGVEINRGLTVERNVILKGTVKIGRNVTIGENVSISNYPGQVVEIGDNSVILRGDVIKGCVKIGPNVHIETGVRITGSSEEPVVIGNNVLIKGITYIFGSVIENDILIEHSILKNKYVEKVLRKNGDVQPVKYILPYPEGLDSITDIARG